MRKYAWAALGLGIIASGCGEDAALSATLLTVEPVRGAAQLGDETIAVRARAAIDAPIAVAEGGLARVSLDSGPQLLCDSGTRITAIDDVTLRIDSGRAYAEASPSDELFLQAEQGSLRVSDASVSVELTSAGLVAYVVRGEASYSTGERRGIARAGERVTLTGSEARIEPATLWHDWTGGLARPGPGDAGGPAGVGVLEARVPDEIGQARWPLAIRRLDVQVRIVGDLAITEVEQVFFNPASETVEGLYRIRVPESAVLQRFAVDRNGTLVDGYVREEAQARQAYEAQVYRGSTLDPALLEWVAPGSYRARIYPIQPGESRRIVIRYAEWLGRNGESGPRLYRYPMGGGRNTPRVQELSVTVDVAQAGAQSIRAGMGAAIEEGRVRLRRSDFVPRSDFWLELVGGENAQRAWRAPHEAPPRAPDARAVTNEADERDYWYLPLRIPERLAQEARAEGVDLVIVADVSAATDRAHLELGRTVVEAITAHLGENDRVAIASSDLAIRPLGEARPQLGAASGARLESLLDALARAPAGGATDLGAAIGQASALLDPARAGAVIYVGDGAPTVGELEADGLLQRMARLPSPPRLYAVAVGSDSRLDLLETLTRGGGLALRVEERSAAADAALSVLAHLSRPVAQRVTVELGAGLDNVYPRTAVDVVIGDVLPVVGRIREEPPTQVTVRGVVAGREFEETIAITTELADQSTDLRLRWAGERLRNLLLDGAGREEVAELGTRYGLITPYTSYYVPSAQELAQMGASASRWIAKPELLAEARRADDVWAQVALTVALGPLALSGCSQADNEPMPAQEMPAEESAAMGDDQEGGRGARASNVGSNRYGLQGPSDEPAAQVAPTTAAAAEPMPVAPQPMPSSGAVADGFASPEAEAAPAPPPPVVAPIGGEAGGLGNSGTGSGYGRGGGGSAAPPARMEYPAPSTPTDATATRSRRAAGPSRASALDDILAGALDGDRDGADEAEEARTTEREASLGSPNPYDRGSRLTAITTVSEVHARSRCSDAADLPLSERSALWGERLANAGGPSGWVDVYRHAVRDCEARDWRDRRELLGLALTQAGSVDRMLDLYRLLDSGAARGYLRAQILRRVRSPQDLRSVRDAFGLGAEPDWVLVEQVLARATNTEQRVRALRRLVAQYPDSFDLKLRLLELLETSGHAPEALRLADSLRADPRSDAGVRTAVGEMLLRMDREDEARRVFSEIVEFAPLDELARRRLGDLYRAHGWFDDAYRQYQTLASIRPDDPSVLLLLAQAAAGSGRVDEALRLEQRLMETAQPGAERGIARIAQLWSSVRLAKLRAAAREARNEDRLEALEQRLRRSGVLQTSGDLRVTLVWSHPDAQIALMAKHPGGVLARPDEIAPEFGIEAFDVPEQESGAYEIAVQRSDVDSPTAIEAELVVVYHEGRADEVVRVLPLRFEGERDSFAWSLRGSDLTPL